MVGAIKCTVAAIGVIVTTVTASAAQTIEIMSTSGYGCCVAWARHLERNGFETKLKNLTIGDLWQHKMQVGLKQGLTSCHTGVTGGYVVVPFREIERLLRERPDAIGLVMPYGRAGTGR